MWSPRGDKKCEKVVSDRNPKPIPMGESKTAQRRNPEKPTFSTVSRKSRKTVKIPLFTTFPSPGKTAKTDRERGWFLAKVTKTGQIKHENQWF